MKIVVLDGYAVNPGDVDWSPLKELGDLTVYDRTSDTQIEARAGNADVVLTNKVPMDAQTIGLLKKCKLIGVLATGYNLIDLHTAKAHGIVVVNVPSYSTASVAQATIALLLALTNHVEDYDRRNRAGRWSECKDFCYFDDPIFELDGKIMGIVGYGHIGRAVAQVARAMGMSIAAYTSNPQDQVPEVIKMGLAELFTQCDVVSLHCPLTPENHGFVNSELINLMKPTALLLNTSRGALVNEADLARALDNGTLKGAGLDVLAHEPPSLDNPLFKARNCIITPHIGWASVESRSKLIKTMAENISLFLAGTPQNVVN